MDSFKSFDKEKLIHFSKVYLAKPSAKEEKVRILFGSSTNIIDKK